MPEAFQIAEDLLQLAAQASSIGLEEAARQISLNAGLVLAESQAAVPPVPDLADPLDSPEVELGECDNVVPFVRPAAYADARSSLHRGG